MIMGTWRGELLGKTKAINPHLVASSHIEILPSLRAKANDLPLCSGNAIRKKVVQGLEPSPQNAGDAHTAWLMSRQEHTRLGHGTSLRGRCSLRPFVYAMDFTMKDWALGLRVGLGIHALQI